jgi:predicted DCC family thiol-disulfide oxidoreductase YuxK
VASNRPLLLYDGACALCNGAVTFVLKRDPGGVARFAPLQGDTAAEALARHPHLAGIDSMIWIDADGRAWTRSAAAIAIGHYLGGRWGALASLARIVPTVLRDVVYDLIARIRYRVFGRYDVCPAPPSEHRARFLP